jgi:hypothetical protein
MNTPRFIHVHALRGPVLLAAGLLAGPAAHAEEDAAVTVADNGRSWKLDNGIVKAMINKNNGNLTSLLFHGLETMGGGGYWRKRRRGRPD